MTRMAIRWMLYGVATGELKGTEAFQSSLHPNCSAGLILMSPRSASHLQQPLGVAGEDLGLVLVAQRHRFHPLGARRVRHERPVDREQDAVDAHFHHAA